MIKWKTNNNYIFRQKPSYLNLVWVIINIEQIICTFARDDKKKIYLTTSVYKYPLL